MTIAYFDCFSGVAGYMILAAGLLADGLRETLGTLPVEGYELSIERITK